MLLFSLPPYLSTTLLLRTVCPCFAMNTKGMNKKSSMYFTRNIDVLSCGYGSGFSVNSRLRIHNCYETIFFVSISYGHKLLKYLELFKYFQI